MWVVIFKRTNWVRNATSGNCNVAIFSNIQIGLQKFSVNILVFKEQFDSVTYETVTCELRGSALVEHSRI